MYISTCLCSKNLYMKVMQCQSFEGQQCICTPSSLTKKQLHQHLKLKKIDWQLVNWNYSYSMLQKVQEKEAATRGVLWKKVFLEISQNSQENTCVRASFLIKHQACNFIKKEALAQVFSCEFCEISKSTFFQNTSGQLLFMKYKGNHIVHMNIHHFCIYIFKKLYTDATRLF